MKLSPSLNVFDRYLWRQLLGFFLLSLLIFTLIAFLSDAFLDFLKNMQELAIPPDVAFRMVTLHLPSAFAFALPASTLMTVLVVYNVLNNHHELIIFRSSGMSLWRLAQPAVILGLITTTLTFLLMDQLAPWGLQLANQLKLQTLQQEHLPIGKQSFTLMERDEQRRISQVIHVAQVNKNQVFYPTLIDVSNPSQIEVVHAKSGTLNRDVWDFEDVHTLLLSRKDDTTSSNQIKHLIKRDVLKDLKQLDEQRSKIQLSSYSFADLRQLITEKQAKKEDVPSKFYVRLWEKLTLPFSCLAFALLGVPLAIQAPRKTSEGSFILAILVLFGLYLIRSVLLTLAQQNLFTLGGLIPLSTSLLIASWTPVLILLGLALFWMWRKNNR